MADDALLADLAGYLEAEGSEGKDDNDPSPTLRREGNRKLLSELRLLSIDIRFLAYSSIRIIVCLATTDLENDSEPTLLNLVGWGQADYAEEDVASHLSPQKVGAFTGTPEQSSRSARRHSRSRQIHGVYRDTPAGNDPLHVTPNPLTTAPTHLSLCLSSLSAPVLSAKPSPSPHATRMPSKSPRKALKPREHVVQGRQMDLDVEALSKAPSPSARTPDSVIGPSNDESVLVLWVPPVRCELGKAKRKMGEETTTILAIFRASQSASTSHAFAHGGYSRPGRRLYVVTCKFSRADIYYIYDNTGLEIRAGDLVITEGDHGCDPTYSSPTCLTDNHTSFI
ncbi:hypothetical protein K491DRAFT_723469 [Lophiostoma macrostomum CBS 122681]|uniref:Uncharacterized protein n=1 Tax=Lophiostoma macrostomum CBS 122681 TaxID=1314788 RepID=A0A6A6SK94_9PLEO|nr:hypothetical protein K491DRAFT_723469 [Lophiostoma macrostomum CBS 122681]